VKQAVTNAHTYRFGPFQLDMAMRELRKAEATVPLPASAFDCLVYLIEHRERPVGRDELVAAVWGRGDVSENLLGHTIVRLRRVLGDTSSEQHSIRTIARVGYRWVADTITDGEQATASTAAVDGPSATQPVAASIDMHDPDAALPTAESGWRGYMRVRPAMAGISFVVLAVFAASWRLLVPGAARPTARKPLVVAVLPADITAPGQWDWLRLGLMEPIARHLRCAHVVTMPSYSVIALLKGRGTAHSSDVLWTPQLHLSFSVQTSANFERGSWRVIMIARDPREEVARVDAQDVDVLSAATRAADAIAARIGCHSAHAGNGSEARH